MQKILDDIYEVCVGGALRKGWGGDACRLAVPMSTRTYECLGWMVVCFLVYRAFDFNRRLKTLRNSIENDLAQRPITSRAHAVDKFLSAVCFGLFAWQFWFKYKTSALIWILQPCHMVLLLEGISLFSEGYVGIMLSICILPCLTGTLLAMIMPDTGGLDMPYEMELYWIQHYLIQSMPIYLLTRRNFLGAKHVSAFSVLVGVWTLLLLHFSFYEVIDLTYNMNVEFMLCPTEGMNSIFPLIPQILLWPTYRSGLTYFVFLISVPIPYFYIYISGKLQSWFSVEEKAEKVV